MITTDIAIDRIEGKGLMPADLRLSNIEPATQDRRSEPRKQRNFHLKCKIYNIESDTFEISNVIVHNYGANGLYFETRHPFQPHEPVCLFSVDQLLDACDSEFAKGVHAQIVWCKPLNTVFDPRYGVGVKYFEPIEAHIGNL
jgi:hypothetical protein